PLGAVRKSSRRRGGGGGRASLRERQHAGVRTAAAALRTAGQDDARAGGGGREDRPLRAEPAEPAAADSAGAIDLRGRRRRHAAVHAVRRGAAPGGRDGMREPSEIIVRPLLTEKSTDLQ